MGWTVRGSNPVGGEIFRTRTQAPTQWVRGLFAGGKVAGAWRWPPTPSSPEVKERVQLYFYSHSWPVLGRTLHPIKYREFTGRSRIKYRDNLPWNVRQNVYRIFTMRWKYRDNLPSDFRWNIEGTIMAENGAGHLQSTIKKFTAWTDLLDHTLSWDL